MDPGAVDLLAEESLPAAWRRRAEEAPDQPALWATGPGWLSRGRVGTGQPAGRGPLPPRRAGPASGVLCSAATSMELVVAYLAALRLGLVVVPANTAYLEREIAHVVGDAEPRAAIVDDPERGEWSAARASCWAPSKMPSMASCGQHPADAACHSSAPLALALRESWLPPLLHPR